VAVFVEEAILGFAFFASTTLRSYNVPACIETAIET
jgi:hypothetical protein